MARVKRHADVKLRLCLWPRLLPATPPPTPNAAPTRRLLKTGPLSVAKSEAAAVSKASETVAGLTGGGEEGSTVEHASAAVAAADDDDNDVADDDVRTRL